MQNIPRKYAFKIHSFCNLQDDIDDYTFLPIKRPNLISYYYKQRNVHWVPTDVDMRGDRNDFDKCDTNTQIYIKGILGFFAPADGLVGENIFKNFQEDTSFWKEARYFYAEQGSMETIHGEMYSILINELIRDDDEKSKLFNSVRNYKSVGKIADFIKKYMNRDHTLPIRILAFICVEGIFFSGAFASIYWLKKRNILKGLTLSNEFIARDEAIHVEFGIELYTMVCMRTDFDAVTHGRMSELINEAIGVVEDFNREILPVELIGMDATRLLNYCKFIADYYVEKLGYNKIYNIENPFNWMARIGLNNKTNFFEGNVSEYSQQTQNDEFVFDETIEF